MKSQNWSAEKALDEYRLLWKFFNIKAACCDIGGNKNLNLARLKTVKDTSTSALPFIAPRVRQLGELCLHRFRSITTYAKCGMSD